METENNEFAAEIAAAPNLQYYGLTEDGLIVELPLAPYASTALRLFAEARAAAGEERQILPMVFNPHEYRTILSAVDAELNDLDGDGHIPTYLVIPFSTQLPVFPHFSVDTDEEAREFMQGYPTHCAGPVKLIDVRDKWPKVVDPEPVLVTAPTEVEPD